MDYHDTYTSEVFQASDCLAREATVTDVIRQCLADHGWQVSPECRDIYHRRSQRAIVSVVDDIEHVNHEYLPEFWSSITDRDIIITDNCVTRPTRAQIVRLPPSWFGIYCHEPQISVELPDRAFAMTVNRIDYNRTLILLLMQNFGHLAQGYVNFNCADHSQHQTLAQRLDLWQENTRNIQEAHPDTYQESVRQLTRQMPLRNHGLDHDIVGQSGGVNVVIETYASNYSVSFSEKIFRALVTPRPWILFGGTWSVAELERLGFDVMRDLMDHSYDHLRMGDDKISAFVAANRQHWGRWPLEFLNHTTLQFYQRWYRRYILPRAQRAAAHNLQLLRQFRRQWWRDFPDFLDQLNSALEKP